MARLPRYRPLGISATSLPGVNFAATGQAQARVAQTIANSLDRMSSFAFREAEIQAKIEGAEYGAGNAPTAQQLLDAQTPAELEALVPGGTGTVRDRAARAAALEVIGLQLETATREEITSLRLNAASTNMPTADLQSKIDGVIDGYSGALFDINPALSKRFRASMATVGNSAVVAHANKLASIQEKQDKVDAIKNFDQIKNFIPDIIANGNLVDPNTGAVVSTVDELIAQQRSEVFRWAEAFDDPVLLKQQLDDFDKLVLGAKTTHLTDWAMESPRTRTRQLRQGEFTDPKIATLWGGLDDTQKASVRDAVRKAETDQNALLLNRENVDEMFVKRRVDGLVPLINNGLRNGEDVSGYLAELEGLDPDKAETMRNIRDTKGGVDNADTVRDLDLLSAKGELTQEDILEAVQNRNLTVATADGFFGELSALQDKRATLAIGILSDAYEKPDVVMMGRALTADENKRFAEFAKHKRYMINEMQANPDFNPLDYANGIAESRQERLATAGEIRALETSINEAIEVFPTVSAITDTELRIKEAQRLLNEPYKKGGIISSSSGVSPQMRIRLMDVVKQLKQLQRLRGN